MSEQKTPWTQKIAALQDKKEYAELNWEGSFEDYLELVRNNAPSPSRPPLLQTPIRF